MADREVKCLLYPVNGLETHYRDTGEGPPLVWVMGTGMNGDAWHRYQVPEFSNRYRCITYDLRGSGRSDALCYTPPCWPGTSLPSWTSSALRQRSLSASA